MVFWVRDLSDMATIAELRNMHGCAANIRRILAVADFKSVNHVRITRLGGVQGDTLSNLAKAAREMRAELAADEMASERASAAYAMGRL